MTEKLSSFLPKSFKRRIRTSESICKKCGSEREILYEVNWQPVYYCPECGTTDYGPDAEFYGPEEKAIDEAGQ